MMIFFLSYINLIMSSLNINEEQKSTLGKPTLSLESRSFKPGSRKVAPPSNTTGPSQPVADPITLGTDTTGGQKTGLSEDAPAQTSGMGTSLKLSARPFMMKPSSKPFIPKTKQGTSATTTSGKLKLTNHNYIPSAKLDSGAPNTEAAGAYTAGTEAAKKVETAGTAQSESSIGKPSETVSRISNLKSSISKNLVVFLP